MIALTDGLAQVKTQYTYSPYGETTASGEANANALQYTGRENDGTGLYFYRARYYNPAIGRFITSDPIGLAGGINTYTYVENRPRMLTDPMGLDAFMCTKPLHAMGGSGAKSGPDIWGNPAYHQYICVKVGNTTVCGGQDRAGGPWSPGKPSDDKFNPSSCEKKDDRSCMDKCLTQKIQNREPSKIWPLRSGDKLPRMGRRYLLAVHGAVPREMMPTTIASGWAYRK